LSVVFNYMDSTVLLRDISVSTLTLKTPCIVKLLSVFYLRVHRNTWKCSIFTRFKASKVFEKKLVFLSHWISSWKFLNAFCVFLFHTARWGGPDGIEV